MNRFSQVSKLCTLLYSHNVPDYIDLAEKLYAAGVRVTEPKWRIDEIRTNRRGERTLTRLSGRFDTEVEARKYVVYLAAGAPHGVRVAYEVHLES